MQKFIKLEEVMSITGLSRSSIYQFVAEGTFPPKVKLGGRSIAWVANEVHNWMNSRVADRDNIAGIEKGITNENS